MFGGELSNLLIYFLIFGNVSIKDCVDLRGIFGFGFQCKWKFWVFEERIKNVERVEFFKVVFNGKLMLEKQKRMKVIEYIVCQKSCQEFFLLVGKLIDKVYVEFLYLKNNVWVYFFKVILKEVVGKLNILLVCKIFF